MFLQSFEVHLDLAPGYACGQGFAKLLREIGTRLFKKNFYYYAKLERGCLKLLFYKPSLTRFARVAIY